MGINSESDVAANLQIGPTDLGMVRLFIDTGSMEIPMRTTFMSWDWTFRPNWWGDD